MYNTIKEGINFKIPMGKGVWEGGVQLQPNKE